MEFCGSYFFNFIKLYCAVKKARKKKARKEVRKKKKENKVYVVMGERFKVANMSGDSGMFYDYARLHEWGTMSFLLAI